MATVNKDFKIKSGLIVEGTTATVNGFDVLTKKTADQEYIIDLIGGSAVSTNTPDTVVLRDGAGSFAAEVITVNTLYVGGSTDNGIDVVDGDTELGSNNGIRLSASDDIVLVSDVGDIHLHPDGNAYYGVTKTTGNIIVNRNYLESEVTTALTTAQGYADAVASDLTDHENATEAHGATGAVVGTTNTQTLTNKTIGDTLNFTGAGDMTINSDSHIVLTPAGGSSVKWGADVLATQAYADAAEADAISSANSYTDGRETAITTAYQTYADQAEVDAKAYADTQVANLVDGAPALLDTLNELAAAIADDEGFSGTVATSIGLKVSKAGDTMTGALTLSGTPTSSLHAATKGYVDGEISTLDTAAQGYANGAETDANAYTDGEITTALSTAQGYANTAETDANGYTDSAISSEVSSRNTAITNAVNALSTSDIEEGSNLYHTDGRAKDSAADLLTGANLTNITITGTGAGLTITAENGVADSDTDDLVEGTTNKYFTEQRAVDALEAVVPNFTAVELNSVAKQVAATLSAPTAGVQTAHAFAKAEYRSAEYLVKVAYGSHTEISKVLLTLDSSDNIAITEYGVVGTNGSASSISAGISGANVQLLVTTANNNSTVTVMGTLLV